MPSVKLAVAISTFNRANLLQRALFSVSTQDFSPLEIIVVDDASSDSTAQDMKRNFPMVRYFRQSVNQGCGAARNRAVQEAESSWVVILDDDDTLLPGALSFISNTIAGFQQSSEFPVLQFAHGNGFIAQSFTILTLEHYVGGSVKGDFVPVINRRLFLEKGLAYPTIRSAGEHILWWDMAENFGIPTWSQRVGTVHSDAPLRLTSTRSQLRTPRLYAELQEHALSRLSGPMAEKFPEFIRKKRLGAATYRLLSGDRQCARRHLKTLMDGKVNATSLALLVLSYMPLSIVKRFFAWFRTATA